MSPVSMGGREWRHNDNDNGYKTGHQILELVRGRHPSRWSSGAELLRQGWALGTEDWRRGRR